MVFQLDRKTRGRKRRKADGGGRGYNLFGIKLYNEVTVLQGQPLASCSSKKLFLLTTTFSLKKCRKDPNVVSIIRLWILIDKDCKAVKINTS